ncbi:ATP-binding cassette domain-containing protein [Candidatus Falkowbacteria bacterium]|nr:ATP-binding cassette domain-containing protein [Candidatus Falkowbacteria bacterium]
MDPVIQSKNVDITYNLGKKNEFKATSDFSLEIYPGEFVAFFGPSGCGKSTLFYSILGILKPSAGELLVKGENPYTFSPEEMVYYQSKSIGIIYQAFYLIDSLSVIDNVTLPQIFMGVSPGKRRKRGMELLNRFGLGEKADSFPTLLSGGQMQRVSVSRSLVNNPDIILADEPTGNLDSKSSDQVMHSLDDISRIEKKTIIMITHNASQLHWVHRVIYIKDGRLMRIVPNPDRKQIAKFDKQKILVTEMELLAKMFPYAPPEELKVKSVVNYLTQDLTFMQINNLENTVREILERKINKTFFLKKLLAPTQQGGVALDEERAKVIAEKIDQIVRQSEEVRRYRRRQNQGTFYNREDKLVTELLNYIITEAKIELGRTQKMRLKEAVKNRVAGIIRREKFSSILESSKEDGGIGLSKDDRENIIRYLEKLLTQGVDIHER